MHPTTAVILPLIGAWAKNNLHLFKWPWLDYPQTAGFLLRNVRLWILKSLDGYSMISHGCGDHQIPISHKTMRRALCVDGGMTHSCDTAKQENSMMATSCLITFFLMRNLKYFYVQLPDPHPCVVLLQRFLGPRQTPWIALYCIQYVIHYKETNVKVNQIWIYIAFYSNCIM